MIQQSFLLLFIVLIPIGLARGCVSGFEPVSPKPYVNGKHGTTCEHETHKRMRALCMERRK